jgi:hypothetical protein
VYKEDAGARPRGITGFDDDAGQWVLAILIANLARGRRHSSAGLLLVRADGLESSILVRVSGNPCFVRRHERPPPQRLMPSRRLTFMHYPSVQVRGNQMGALPVLWRTTQ